MIFVFLVFCCCCKYIIFFFFAKLVGARAEGNKRDKGRLFEFLVTPYFVAPSFNNRPIFASRWTFRLLRSLEYCQRYFIVVAASRRRRIESFLFKKLVSTTGIWDCSTFVSSVYEGWWCLTAAGESSLAPRHSPSGLSWSRTLRSERPCRTSVEEKLRKCEKERELIK